MLTTAPAADPLATALARFAPLAEQSDADPLPAFVALFDALRPRWLQGSEAAVARYGALVERLEGDPRLARAVGRSLLRLLASRRLVSFFADSGILRQTGFVSGLARIVVHRLLPELPDERDFRGCVQRVFHRPGDWKWLQLVPPELQFRFWSLVIEGNEDAVRRDLHRVADQMLEAVLVLAYRIGGIEVEQEFGRLGPRFLPYAQRVRGLARAAQQYVDACRAQLGGKGPLADAAELRVLIDQCHELLDDAHRASLQFGTTVDLTFLMRRARQSLRRLATLLQMLSQSPAAAAARGAQDTALESWSALTRDAIRAELRRHSLREHFSSGLSLLALRVTDHAAKTGEHYIAGNGAEYLGMWRAAMGAGLLIAAMALLKVFTSKLDLAPAGYALGYSLIYGLGFVVIYMLHWTVATKQPAMTAQTIAGYLGEANRGRVGDLERVVDLVAAVTRSQLAAIAGNVLVALPMAMIIASAWQQQRGAPPFDAAKALKLLAELDPLALTLPHAALAGVFLYLSGLLSGYFDNKASYARVGERISQLRWLRLLAGVDRTRRVGRYVEDHLGGLMGNFLFGCMLGSAGTIGMIFGLPIDIRHVAFASANFGYAVTVLDFDLPWQAAAWALLGVALIGLVNLAVSFSLALWTALRARGIVFTQTRELLRRILWRFRVQPSSFLLPRPDLETTR